MTPAGILFKALRAYDDHALRALAKSAGVTPENVMRAANGSRGRRPNVNDYVRLCAVLGIDPVTGAKQAPWVPQDLHASTLAIAVRMRRIERGDSNRLAARKIGVSISTLSRIENGNPRSFECVRAACKYIGLDPRLYLNVTRETTGNTLISQEIVRRAA